MNLEMHVAAGRTQRQRQIVSAFEAVDALDEARGRTIQELRVRVDSDFDRLLRVGIIQKTADGKYFLSRESVRLNMRRSMRDLLIAIGVIVVVLSAVIVWQSLSSTPIGARWRSRV